jgi:lactoylglutathione lyase
VKLFPMLSCADLDRSLALYRDMLGGVETFRFPPEGEPGYISLDIGDSHIGLGSMAGPPIHGRPQRPATGHRIELCVYVDDVDESYKQAGEQGLEQVVEPADMPWGERVAYIADPDGNLLMLTAQA